MSLLNATTTATTAASGGIVGIILFYVVVIGGFFFFVIYRPQKKEQKKISELMASIEIGDFVLTSSGFYGSIIDITDDTVIVEFGNNKNCRIPMKKSAIIEVEKPGEE